MAQEWCSYKYKYILEYVIINKAIYQAYYLSSVFCTLLYSYILSVFVFIFLLDISFILIHFEIDMLNYYSCS